MKVYRDEPVPVKEERLKNKAYLYLEKLNLGLVIGIRPSERFRRPLCYLKLNKTRYNVIFY